MKKLVLMSRHWVKVAASKTVGNLGNLVDGLLSGSPSPPFMITSPGGRMTATEAMMAGRAEQAFREALGAQQAAYMGGPGGQLLEQLLGTRVAYPYATGKPMAL